MKGDQFLFENIRVCTRKEALKAVEKSRKLMAQRQKLVDEGKAKWVIEPISNGYRKIFVRL